MPAIARCSTLLIFLRYDDLLGYISPLHVCGSFFAPSDVTKTPRLLSRVYSHFLIISSFVRALQWVRFALCLKFDVKIISLSQIFLSLLFSSFFSSFSSFSSFSCLRPIVPHQLVNELGGPEKVSEMTGRKGRMIKKANGDVVYERRTANGISMTMQASQRTRTQRCVLLFENQEKSMLLGFLCTRRVRCNGK